MAIVATDKGNFTPAPEGVHQAVCVDVIDLGKIFSEKFNSTSHKIDIVFQLATLNQDTGKPFQVRQRQTLSLSPKANMRSFLEAWRGKQFTQEELKDGFDVEKLRGANANVNIVHNGEWANIKSIMPLTEGQTPIVARDYVRATPKTTVNAPVNSPAAAAVATAEMTVANSEIPTSTAEIDIPF